LLNAGYRLLRFTAADIHQRPDVVTSEVSQALRTALRAAAASG
jgi:very-short-patch-repair endonuclease